MCHEAHSYMASPRRKGKILSFILHLLVQNGTSLGPIEPGEGRTMSGPRCKIERVQLSRPPRFGVGWPVRNDVSTVGVT